jgi:Flp pilus assembly protein TadG
MTHALLRRRGDRPSRLIALFATDSSGAFAVPVAIALVVLLGFAGLGGEVASWYVARRTMQGAADSAAYTAAYAKAANATTAIYTSEATSVASSYGFVDGSSGVAVGSTARPRKERIRATIRRSR